VKINRKKVVQVDAKTLQMHLKVCDNFSANLVDADGQVIASQDDGYVPSFMPGEHHGDYVILDIDIDTGTITNWKKPTAKALEEFIAKCGDDEDEED
jgi:hypothetical protein